MSNTTPISELAKIGRLKLLNDLYGHVIVPQEVYEEVTVGDHPAVREVQHAGWISVMAIHHPQAVEILRSAGRIGRGEAAAIVLANELSAERLLIDDRAARREAQRLGLPLIGTLGILVLAKRASLIGGVGSTMDDLRAHGTYIGQRLYEHVLRLAGE